MKKLACVELLTAAVLLFTRPGEAQEECSVSTVGQPCDAGTSGTCIGASCTDTVDGSTTSRACAACVSLPSNTCPDAGGSCGDGGVCSEFGELGGGGSTNGAFSFTISYSYAVCEYPDEAGAGEADAAVLGTSEAEAGVPVRSGEAGSLPSEDGAVDAGESETGSVASVGGGGCAIAGGATPCSVGGVGLWGVAALLLRRKRLSPQV